MCASTIDANVLMSELDEEEMSGKMRKMTNEPRRVAVAARVRGVGEQFVDFAPALTASVFRNEAIVSSATPSWVVWHGYTRIVADEHGCYVEVLPAERGSEVTAIDCPSDAKAKENGWTKFVCIRTSARDGSIDDGCTPIDAYYAGPIDEFRIAFSSAQKPATAANVVVGNGVASCDIVDDAPRPTKKTGVDEDEAEDGFGSDLPTFAEFVAERFLNVPRRRLRQAVITANGCVDNTSRPLKRAKPPTKKVPPSMRRTSFSRRVVYIPHNAESPQVIPITRARQAPGFSQ